jgi:uncharacterized membrane protein
MSEALVILFFLFAWFVGITLVAVVWRVIRGRPRPQDVELEELRARYAQGEISTEEYDGARHRLVAR